MSIRGITKQIATTPVAQKNMHPEETYIPYTIDLRNGRLTDAGNWDKRPGFGIWRETGASSPVNLLIPEDNGFAITEDKRVFELTPTSQIELSGEALNGDYRPIYTNFNDKYIIVDGGNPMKISKGSDGTFSVAVLGGSPPNARFVDTLGAFVIMAGQVDDKKAITISAPNNEEDYVGNLAETQWVKNDGQDIRNLKVLNEIAYAFKDFSIEAWINIQSSTKTFQRQSSASIWNIGCIADYSVIKTRINNTICWFGHDRRFYQLLSGGVKIISDNIEKYLFTLLNPSEIYGFDYEKESVIRWFAPTDGKCFVYDYKNSVMYEDNTWDHGQWERMPVNSYMELNGKQYFGDFDPTGKIFEWSTKYKDDNGKPIRNYRLMRIRPSSKGNNTRLNRIGFGFYRGTEAFSSTEIPVLFWRYNIDNSGWSNYMTISLGQDAQRKLYYEEFPGAVGLNWDIEVVHTDNSDFTLINMDATFQEMGR